MTLYAHLPSRRHSDTGGPCATIGAGRPPDRRLQIERSAHQFGRAIPEVTRSGPEQDGRCYCGWSAFLGNISFSQAGQLLPHQMRIELEA
jgi:hypothetical protein